MGAWISTLQFNYFYKQIKGFIGIGSAPEFLEHVMWKKFTKKMKHETKKNGIYNLRHGGFEYPITYQLIKDGRKNKVLNRKLKADIKIILFHGSNDEAVPVKYSKKLLKIFSCNDKKLVIIRKGNHSLFTKKCQRRILIELDNLITKLN